MKIEPVKNHKTPSYPTIERYVYNPHEFLRHAPHSWRGNTAVWTALVAFTIGSNNCTNAQTTKPATEQTDKKPIKKQQSQQRQISIAPDGLIYPCVQFVKDGINNKAYSIGNVWDGFNEKRAELLDESIIEKETCRECAIKSRCYNTCSCLNYQTTGSINAVSPLLCSTERMLAPIVDKLGEELYKKRATMFIQKQYNTVYPLLSMLEDEAKNGTERNKI
ncbi:MAG: SPASM domain-containing protein [Dysgonamonadaceae bacterium]|jgi:radical SAM protein with 4Fe4S-binding SPASM domain|nr:SPASM domain-containing protein [Dysgonamonadaceae bacterium]